MSGYFIQVLGRIAMAEEKSLSAREVKLTISTALAAAFGFVIALLWKDVVTGGLTVAGVDMTFGEIDLVGWLVYMILAVVLTVVMVILIVVVGRWGSK
jgi:uncharacterized protein YacL